MYKILLCRNTKGLQPGNRQELLATGHIFMLSKPVTILIGLEYVCEWTANASSLCIEQKLWIGLTLYTCTMANTLLYLFYFKFTWILPYF